MSQQISAMQNAGIPLQRLMLPRVSVVLINEEMVSKVRKLVKVDDFSLDWPNPFERFRYFSSAFVYFLLCQKFTLLQYRV